MIRVFRPHLELYSVNNKKGPNALTLFLHIKREKEQICSTKTKEEICLNETKGMELVRLLQMHRLTYLTKLTPREHDFIFYLGRKVIRLGATSLLMSSSSALVQMGVKPWLIVARPMFS